jgi:hypothetical protein
MAKRKSELRELLILIRRIIVLSVAAFGLWREMPYEALAVRVAILWGILYLATESVEVLFRFLSSRANTVVIHEKKSDSSDQQEVVEQASLHPSN